MTSFLDRLRELGEDDPLTQNGADWQLARIQDLWQPILNVIEAAEELRLWRIERRGFTFATARLFTTLAELERAIEATHTKEQA